MTDETKAVLSVLEIIKLQEFLKSKKINYRFMTYANYWNDTTNTSGSLSSINNYKSVQVLSEGLDFNQFIFYNNQRDGLYEFAKATNQICDGFHPTSIAAENWSQIIIDNLGI